MRMIGKFDAFVLLVIGAIAAVAAARSLPDIKRYQKMRQM